MKKLLPISIGFSSIIKALVLSIPFGLVYLLDVNYSNIITISIIGLFGFYFLFSLYLLKKRRIYSE